MDNLVVVIPYYDDLLALGRLLASLTPELPVIVVDDGSKTPLRQEDVNRPDTWVHRLPEKGYFTGAVNAGLHPELDEGLAEGDVLIVNQDAYFTGQGWLDLLEQNRDHYGLIGEQPLGQRPAFPGYVHGSFLFIRRDVIDKIGLMNAELYPMWGSTGEYQLRACRAGFEVLPVATIPDFHHRPDKPGRYGPAMAKLIETEPDRKAEFTRVPPEVSVIIPCYNYGRYLPDAVESLLAQTFQSFEIIIVNDASTDDSLEMAQLLADPWQAIRVLHLKDNVGTAAAVNAGIGQANGKYIARLDADDMMRPYRLENFFQLQLKNPHSFIFDYLILFGSEMEKTPGATREGEDIVYHLPDYDFERLIHKNGVHAGIMFPRQAWLDTGGYPGNFRDGRDDWAFNVALGIKGYCGVKADRPGYLYRRDGQNRTLANTRPADYQMFQEKMIRHFPDIYRGVRPMGCCGTGISQISKSGGSQLPAQMTISGLPGKTGFEVLEYIGSSSSDMSWWGPATKTRYVFGGTRRVGYVDARDAAGMLQMGDNGRANFRIYVKPEIVEQPVEIIVETVSPNGHAVEIIIEPEAATLAPPALVETTPKTAPSKRAVKRK